MFLPLLLALGCVDVDRDGWPIPDDCNDRDATVHPGAPERCTPPGLDEDCDGQVDGEDPDSVNTLFLDADGDGDGDPSSAFLARSCLPTEGTVDNARDCDDSRPERHAGATELCDSVDNDCDGLVDDEDDDVDPDSATWWYFDDDGDGYGAPDQAMLACAAPSRTVANADDCDDTDARSSPSAQERCDNGRDDNCDGSASPCGFSGLEDVGSHAAWAVLRGSGLSHVGYTTLAPGDLDGDGWPDLLVGAPTDGGDSVLTVFHGPIRAGELAELTVHGPGWWTEEGDAFGAAVLAPGDVDGDGEPDLVVGAPLTTGWAPLTGAVWILPPVVGPRRVSSTSGEGVLGDEGELLGSGLAAGDFDGDGAVDLLVAGSALGAPDRGRGSATVLRGPVAGGMAPNDRPRWLGEEDAGLGAALGAADLDGDGVDDVLLGAPGEGAVYVLPGPPAQALADGNRTALDPSTGWGTALDARRDLDGDGRVDLLVGAPGVGRAEGWTGEDLLGRGSAFVRFEPGVELAGFGRAVVALGDGDGDGDGEVLVTGESAGFGWSVVVYAGPFTGTRTPGDEDGLVRAADGWEFGTRAFDLGDLDLDGRADLAVQDGVGYRDRGSSSEGLWLRFGQGL